MTRILKIVLLLAALIGASGCTTGYWRDRGRDAADIFTFTAGYGLGGKARVGPLALGLGGYRDGVGLTAGEWRHPSPPSVEAQKPGPRHDFLFFAPIDLSVVMLHFQASHKSTHTVAPRNKFYLAGGVLGMGVIGDPEIYPNPLSTRLHFYGQCEAYLACFGGVRAGVNVVEIFDFLLGFVGIDFLDDDLERRKAEEDLQNDDTPCEPPAQPDDHRGNGEANAMPE